MDSSAERRSVPARLGISALNILGPGLGLFRIGDGRAGALFFAAQLVLIVAITGAMWFSPIRSHASAVATVSAIIVAAAALLLGAMFVSWRRSAMKRTPVKVWSRWYGVVAIGIGMLVAMNLAVEAAHRFYRPFYLPTRSMIPTIDFNDRIVADMNWRGPYRRGQIVMFRHRDADWIKRIAALPGDRFAMRNGVPIVNGVTARQTRLREVMMQDDWEPAKGTVSREQLPGEQGSHEVLDTMDGLYDEMPEITVPPGYLIVLGDNRDHSADSRASPLEGGTGPVSISAVMGRASFISWATDRSRTGRRLDR